MLKGNLASRPFYNQRAVGLALALIAILALALTAFNAWRIVTLSAERRTLREQIERSDAEVLRIRSETAQIQGGLDTPTLNSLLAGTQEANGLIDRRAFSWTVFFGYIERTLPIDVRLVSVVPRVTRGAFTVEMLVVARRPGDLEEFAGALRETKAFIDVYPKNDQTNDDGTLSATLVATYLPPALKTPAAAGAPIERGGGRP